MDKSLTQQECVPCKVGAKPLTAAEIDQLRPQLSTGWEVIDVKKLRKTFTCQNFKEAVAFVHRIADKAEQQGHHPDITLHDFKQVTVEWWTHKINGLHHNDFIMAAYTDEVFLP